MACQDDSNEIERAREWLSRDDVVILDTETTGLHQGAHIVAISVIDTKGNILLNTYVKPPDPIDESLSYKDYDWYGNEIEKPTAFAINGIGNETVKDAPTFDAIWLTLQPLLEGKLVLAYNVDFDQGMIDDHYARYGTLETLDCKWYCVMNWYAMYHGEWDERRRNYRWVRLTYACDEQHVEIDNAHDAHGDCLLTLGLIRAIAAKQTPLEKQTTR